MPFCHNCGKEVKEGTKFCSGCGTSLIAESEDANIQQNDNLVVRCPKCGSPVPFGNVLCTNCGSQLNPDKHTAAIVLGYICSIVLPLFGIIFGIYLLTRPNVDVRKHGAIMIILSIFMIFVFILLSSYLSYQNSMRYYRYRYRYSPYYYNY